MELIISCRKCFYDQLPDAPRNNRIPANFMAFKLFLNGHERETSLSINVSCSLVLLSYSTLFTSYLLQLCALFFSIKLTTPPKGRTLQL